MSGNLGALFNLTPVAAAADGPVAPGVRPAQVTERQSAVVDPTDDTAPASGDASGALEADQSGEQPGEPIPGGDEQPVARAQRRGERRTAKAQPGTRPDPSPRSEDDTTPSAAPPRRRLQRDSDSVSRAGASPASPAAEAAAVDGTAPATDASGALEAAEPGEQLGEPIPGGDEQPVARAQRRGERRTAKAQPGTRRDSSPRSEDDTTPSAAPPRRKAQRNADSMPRAGDNPASPAAAAPSDTAVALAAEGDGRASGSSAGGKQQIMVYLPDDLVESFKQEARRLQITYAQLMLLSVEQTFEVELPAVFAARAGAGSRLFSTGYIPRNQHMTPKTAVNLHLRTGDLEVVDQLWRGTAGCRSRNDYLSTAARTYLATAEQP